MAERAIRAVAPYYAELGIATPALPEAPGIPFDDQVAACLESGASVFSFTFGLLPATTVAAIKAKKVLLVGTATTVEEARALSDVGVDAVIAQGTEAGGHRGTFSVDFSAGMIGVIALVPQICDAVSLPVVASGGIMDGRGIAAAIALGASAVQLGTAFLACPEAGVPGAYKDAILTASAAGTRITRAFSGRPARGVSNRFLAEMAGRQDEILPFPLQNAITRPLRTEAARRNRAEYLSLWAGQASPLARRMRAAELVKVLASETEAAIDSLAARR